MSTEILGQKDMLENNYSQAANGSETVEDEVRALREEIAAMRAEFEQRLTRTDKIVGAYKAVLSDMTNLIEAERQENAKREESNRFFMTSAETRIKAEILEELGVESEDEDAPGQSWWPFRKFG